MMRWMKDESGRFGLTMGDGLTWADVAPDFPNGVRKVDWPLFPGRHELSYEHSMASSVDTERGPWEYGTCRHCRREVRLWMMEPEACPRAIRGELDNYTGPTFRETED